MTTHLLRDLGVVDLSEREFVPGDERRERRDPTLLPRARNPPIDHAERLREVVIGDSAERLRIPIDMHATGEHGDPTLLVLVVDRAIPNTQLFRESCHGHLPEWLRIPV